MDLLLLPGLLCDARRLGAGAAAARAVLPSARSPSMRTRRASARWPSACSRDAPPTFALAGHSMGGRVALEIVRRAPRARGAARAARYRLAAAAGGRGRRGREARDGSHCWRSRVRRACARWRGNGCSRWCIPTRLADAALIDTILDMFERRRRRSSQDRSRRCSRDRTRRRCCARSAVPRSCSAAAHDAWSTLAQHEEMAALIPGARLAVIERLRPHGADGAPGRRRSRAAAMAGARRRPPRRRIHVCCRSRRHAMARPRHPKPRSRGREVRNTYSKEETDEATAIASRAAARSRASRPSAALAAFSRRGRSPPIRSRSASSSR